MLTWPGACAVPVEAAGARLIHTVTNLKPCFGSRSMRWTRRLWMIVACVSLTHAGSVMEVGAAAPFAP